ncbi:hypothetical protein HBH98_085290 [Parastagonospora nodorum]|nr:hypothetical protein HBH49_153160 [Parastagonospora nodorum]KAH4347779.1 hypothetical protein HBH98_085290 [Parastagonospora nodorum]KAH4360619.1 hypothetical protein HBH97_202880 [Parastagonospora nodorum]KAH4407578.1 hypothetical protein HBH99_078510 [Parastagonospora nodorum]KAH4955708.1 hypothetical protein HBH73_092800 [Parastagonospora nodorum]
MAIGNPTIPCLASGYDFSSNNLLLRAAPRKLRRLRLKKLVCYPEDIPPDHAITRPKKKAEAAGKRAAGVRKAEDKVPAELVKTKAAAENGEGRTSKEDC